MILNNKQKRNLKAQANRLKPVVMVGKEGISDSLIMNLNNALEAQELVKVSLLKSSPISVNEAAIDLATSSSSEIVGTVGRTIVLFRQSEKKLIEF